MKMPSKKKTCTCGKVIDFAEICECKKGNRNAYQRQYYEKNKEAHKELNSTRWAKKRRFILNRDNSHCQRCLHKYGIIETDKLQVHHIKNRQHHPHLMYEDSNLITVCKTCNLQLGQSDILDFDWQQPEREFNF